MENRPITAIIVGAGHRSFVYSELAKTNPEMLKIVGVADPNPIRRKRRWITSDSKRICALKMPRNLQKRETCRYRNQRNNG